MNTVPYDRRDIKIGDNVEYIVPDMFIQGWRGKALYKLTGRKGEVVGRYTSDTGRPMVTVNFNGLEMSVQPDALRVCVQ